MDKDLFEELIEYKIKYQILLKYLKFQIEKETYINVDKLKLIMEVLEKEEGEESE